MLFAVAVQASSPCSGGATNPLFTLAGSDPAVLRFEHLTSQEVGAPLVRMSGYVIHIDQYVFGGPLPPAALGTACNNTSRPVPSLDLTLHSSPLRLHYENSFLGYAPQLGAPAVSVYEHTISIVQAVVDAGPPENVVCNAEDVDLPPLAPGIYDVRVMHMRTTGDNGGALITGVGGFILAADGSAQCTTTRSFALTSPPVPDSPVVVRSTVMISGFYSSTYLLSRDGSTFHVEDLVSTEFPATYVPYCLTSAVDLGKLPIGAYRVEWKLNDLGIPRPAASGTFSFNVAAPARHRAARK